MTAYSHTVKHYYFRWILASQFSYAENSLHFKSADFPVDFIKQFVFMVMGNSNNSHVFNYVILLKSRKFDARTIYVF